MYCGGSRAGPKASEMNVSVLEALLTSGTQQIPAEWLYYHSDFYFPLTHSCPLAPSKTLHLLKLFALSLGPWLNAFEQKRRMDIFIDT